MPLLTPGQERKRGRRWGWAAVSLAFFAVPVLFGSALYATLRWGPLPVNKRYRFGQLWAVRGNDVLWGPLPEGFTEIPSGSAAGRWRRWWLRVGARVYLIDW